MTSLFEIFKIGIGPSSSHTVGPMIAARRFALDLEETGQLESARHIRAELFGSLAHTGRGHGTDRAVILGLCGEEPHLVDPSNAESLIAEIRRSGTLKLLAKQAAEIDEARDIIFERERQLPYHSNGMTFTALDGCGQIIRSENSTRLAAASL